jgi:hypothetical protein
LFLGRLAEFPADVCGVDAEYRAPTALPPALSTSGYKVLYAIARA